SVSPPGFGSLFRFWCTPVELGRYGSSRLRWNSTAHPGAYDRRARDLSDRSARLFRPLASAPRSTCPRANSGHGGPRGCLDTDRLSVCTRTGAKRALARVLMRTGTAGRNCFCGRGFACSSCTWVGWAVHGLLARELPIRSVGARGWGSLKSTWNALPPHRHG